MALRIESFEQPLEPVTLPRGGRELPAQDFTLGMQKLAQRVDQGDEAAAHELLRRCLPGITDAEIDDLTPKEALLIFAHCAGRLTEVVDALKNAAGAAAASPDQPSAPTTNTNTPSRASGASRAATGGRSRRNRSTASSSL